MTQWNDWSFSPDAMTFTYTGFAAGVGPAPPQSRPPKVVHDLGPYAFRLLMALLGVVTLTLSILTGVDGFTKTIAGVLVGVGVGLKADRLAALFKA